MSSKPKVPKPPPPPNQPTTGEAMSRAPAGVQRRFNLPGVFTTPQGLDRNRQGGRRSLIGGDT